MSTEHGILKMLGTNFAVVVQIFGILFVQIFSSAIYNPFLWPNWIRKHKTVYIACEEANLEICNYHLFKYQNFKKKMKVMHNSVNVHAQILWHTGIVSYLSGSKGNRKKLRDLFLNLLLEQFTAEHQWVPCFLLIFLTDVCNYKTTRK